MGMGGRMFAGKPGPQRDPIDPELERGHGPQGNGKMGDIHTNTRAGDKGNQELGARGYPRKPIGKREAARIAEKQAQQAAKNLARAERDAVLRAEQRAAAAETAAAAEELEAAEILVGIDEAAIAIGIIVK